MREFLLSKFYCSECGEKLGIQQAVKNPMQYATNEPTGSDKVEVAVLVEPCIKCLEPALMAKRAIRMLNEIAKDK